MRRGVEFFKETGIIAQLRNKRRNKVGNATNKRT
jgi:hypothetical protein